MMLNAGEPLLRGEKNIETVAGHRKTESVGFLRARFDRLGRDVLVEFDDLDARCLFLSDDRARIFGTLDQVTALGAQRPRGRRSDQPRSGGPNARAADLTEIGPVLLGQCPLVVVLRDVRTGGDAEMEVELTDEIEQMAMAVDEARQNRLAFHVDDSASGWNCDLATLADRFESIAFDHDDGVFERRSRPVASMRVPP